jgi:hypothetical protein
VDGASVPRRTTPATVRRFADRPMKSSTCGRFGTHASQLERHAQEQPATHDRIGADQPPFVILAGAVMLGGSAAFYHSAVIHDARLRRHRRVAALALPRAAGSRVWDARVRLVDRGTRQTSHRAITGGPVRDFRETFANRIAVSNRNGSLGLALTLLTSSAEVCIERAPSNDGSGRRGGPKAVLKAIVAARAETASCFDRRHLRSEGRRDEWERPKYDDTDRPAPS